MSLSSDDRSVKPTAQILQLRGTFEELASRRAGLVEEIRVIDDTLLRAKQDRYRQFKSNQQAAAWKRSLVLEKMGKERELHRLRSRIADAQHEHARVIKKRLEDEGIDPTDPVSIMYHLLDLVLENEEIGSVEYTRPQRRTISIACAYLEGQGVRSRA